MGDGLKFDDDGPTAEALRNSALKAVLKRASDEELLSQLAKDDPDLAAALRKNLGAPDTFDTRH